MGAQSRRRRGRVEAVRNSLAASAVLDQDDLWRELSLDKKQAVVVWLAGPLRSRTREKRERRFYELVASQELFATDFWDRQAIVSFNGTMI